MVSKKNDNKIVTASQKVIVDRLQDEIIGHYFDAVERDDEFELLSTLRYDPCFTHVFPQKNGNKQITLEEIDHRLRGEQFEQILDDINNGTSNNDNSRFKDYFNDFEIDPSFENESQSSLMSLLENNHDLTSPPCSDSVKSSPQPSNTDLRPIFFNRFLLLGEHYKRLNFALQFFKWGFYTPLDLLLTKLIEALPGHDDTPSLDKKMSQLLYQEECYKMRVLIAKSGRMRIEAHPLPRAELALQVNTASEYYIRCILSGFLLDSTPTWDVFVDTKPISVSPFTTFKTTYRDHYNDARSRLVNLANDFQSTRKTEILVYNGAYQLMEGSITNVAVQKTKEENSDQVRFVTPSLASGCLCGTMRYYLLKKNLIYEQPIDVRDLNEGDVVILFNGVMGAVKGVIRRALSNA